MRSIILGKRVPIKLEQLEVLESTNVIVGQFAHTLRNKLMGTQCCYNLLLQEIVDPQLRELIEGAHEAILAAVLEIKRLEGLVRLQYQQKRRSAQLTSSSLNTLVFRLVKELRRFVGRNVQIELRLESGLDIVAMDPTAFDNMLLNLCSNAADAMPYGGRIVVSTCNLNSDEQILADNNFNTGRAVLLEVRDEGMGIDPETLDEIFNPFFSTKKGLNGLGLGLVIVAECVLQARGQIRLVSTPGQGTAFQLIFPSIGRAQTIDFHD